MPVIRRSALAAIPLIGALLAPFASAQRGTGDWMTSGYDAQRSFWVRSDGKISPKAMQKPGFTLDWKLKVNNTPRGLNMISPPALMDFYIGYRGFRALGFFGASSNKIVGVDTEIARIEWEKTLAPAPSQAGTLDCPGGMTASVTRPMTLDYPGAFTGRGAGRATPAKSGVGEPFEGAVTLKNLPPPRPAAPKPPAPKPAAAKPDLSNPFAPRVQYVLALSGDGKLHAMWVSNGEQPVPGVQFVPPGANATGLLSFNNAVYAATLPGCQGVDSGVWMLDMQTKKAANWKAPGKGVAGSTGMAFTPDGTIYVTGLSGEITALNSETMQPVSSYKGAVGFTTSPLIFQHGDKDLLVAATAEGTLQVFDTKNLQAGPLATSKPFIAAGFEPGALASWKDAAGERWILAPSGGAAATQAGFRTSNGEVKNGAVTAWKVASRSDGKPVLQAGWVSRDMTAPLTPIVVNGVIFAVASGEFRTGDTKLTALDRAKRSGKAVLYALDALTGAEVWNSGDALQSFVHSGGLAVGGGRVYVSTWDGTQYAFGFPIEH